MTELIELSKPQYKLVSSSKRFPAFVGGFGCLRDSTKLLTSNGPLAISDITVEHEILSYSHSNQQFQLAPTSGAFPKGKDYLYRIVTKYGEFVASEHHRILSSDGKYQPVSNLHVGSSLFSFEPNLLDSKQEFDRIWLHEDDQNYWQKLLSYFHHCEDADHQCDQRLLVLLNNALVYSQQQNDVHKLNQCIYENFDTNLELLLKHIHQDQLFFHQSNHDVFQQVEHLFPNEVSQTSKEFFEHTSQKYLQSFQFEQQSVFHQQVQLQQQFSRCSQQSGGPFCRSLTETSVIAIEHLGSQEWFWDLHVAGNNNYVTVDGAIHHNSGKTEAMINRMLMLKYKYPKNDLAYYLPTYDLVSTIGFPRFEEKLEKLKLPFKTRTGIKPRIIFENAGEMLFRTMDNPARIVGYETGHSGVDELDTLKAADAKVVWQKINARNRQKLLSYDYLLKDWLPTKDQNTIAVATTPEGFRFVYEMWKKSPPSNEYELIKASTYDNQQFLPDNYIQDLIDLYPANLVEAYINGEFINLTSGSVYPEFDRILNGTNAVLEQGEAVHIGQDFNVTKMAGVVFVIRNNEPYAVDEFTNVFDTPTAIVLYKQRFAGRQIFIYPDATGSARDSSNASVSDISLLNAAGFHVIHQNTNPLIKDRVLSVNALISKRKLHVNIDKCPSFATGLEQQAYDKNGMPDKTSGLDHCIDAGGYFITNRWPVVRNYASHIKLAGN